MGAEKGNRSFQTVKVINLIFFHIHATRNNFYTYVDRTKLISIIFWGKKVHNIIEQLFVGGEGFEIPRKPVSLFSAPDKLWK